MIVLTWILTAAFWIWWFGFLICVFDTTFERSVLWPMVVAVKLVRAAREILEGDV